MLNLFTLPFETFIRLRRVFIYQTGQMANPSPTFATSKTRTNMNVFDRMRNGWHLGTKSIELIAEHPKLLFFPVLSGVSMLAILVSFVGAFFGVAFFSPGYLESLSDNAVEINQTVAMLVGFLFYLVMYFIIVFFNVALAYNARRVFEGELPSIRDGLAFSAQRAHRILAWAAVAATVGIIIQAIEERLGSFVSGLLGFAWTLSTYFVIPTLAAQDIGPIDALKHSAGLIRQRWGDSIGAGFSMGLFQFAGIFVSFATGALLSVFVHPALGIPVGVVLVFLTIIVTSAARQVFLTAAYENVEGRTPSAFDADTLDAVFTQK